jgi:hypothetical protein
MAEKQWWVVQSFGELLGVTDDLATAEAALRSKYREDFPGVNVAALGFDIKFMDWYLFSSVSRQCLWDYSAKRTGEL